MGDTTSVCRYAVYTATTPSLYHLDVVYKACVAMLLQVS
jgi:hypothetical protein